MFQRKYDNLIVTICILLKFNIYNKESHESYCFRIRSTSVSSFSSSSSQVGDQTFSLSSSQVGDQIFLSSSSRVGDQTFSSSSSQVSDQTFSSSSSQVGDQTFLSSRSQISQIFNEFFFQDSGLSSEQFWNQYKRQSNPSIITRWD